MYRQKRSLVWKYFEKKDTNTAMCLLCKREYKNAGNTSNLHEHLKRKHFTVLEANRERDQEAAESIDIDEPVIPGTVIQDITPVASTSNAYLRAQNADLPTTAQRPQVHLRQLTLRTISNDLSQTKIMKLNNLVVAMICKDLQTLSIVEDKGFIEFVKELEPRYQLPTRRTLGRSILPQVYADTKNKILQNLQETTYVSITTDIWSNLNTQSFLTVTSHYILQDKLYTNVLATSVLDERHTIEYITSIIQDTLTEFNIADKTVAVVTDNAANMIGAVRSLGYLHLPCAAHTLNLVVNDSISAIPDIVSTLKTCRSIVTHFKTSVTAADKLRAIQAQMELQHLKLKQDIHTRWNSSLIMLERLFALRVPLSAAVVSLPKFPRSSETLNEEQWKMIEDVIPLLKPIEYITTDLSAEKYSTASKIVPLITGIQNAIENITPTTRSGHLLKINLLNNIDIRFDYIETNKITRAATILDPRFKTAVFQNNINAQTAKTAIHSEIKTLLNVMNNENRVINRQQDEESPDQNSGFWNFYLNKVSHLTRQCSTPLESAENITKQYLELPYENIKSNPIEFWKTHRHTMPELKKISEKYLCTPATSVPSERIFSKAGQIVKEEIHKLLRRNAP
ncbi:LOW QUALITY PROTEIN: E3 SUMO-protein ligase ZBED1 [Andrena cerasifolii]|uniref:LOW QUALITY PROTEIN: E3 SUMO-protein ligase ZBED1 n=1 Tax=Andrena cerasifolii TaxID=2819439 RepID=UPI004037AE34